MHFGHCQEFAIVETLNGKITGVSKETPPPHEPGVLPKWIHELGVRIVIAGGMGMRAQQLFAQNGITVVTGALVGTPESLVEQHMAGTLTTGPNVCDH